MIASAEKLGRTAHLAPAASNPDRALLAGGSVLSDLLPVLMSGYQNADADAADELVRRVNPILTRYYYALTSSPALVEDLLQECWLRIHRARASYRPGEPVLPWMFAIARHTRIDQYRRWRRSVQRESSIEGIGAHPSLDPRPALEIHLQANAVIAALAAIPGGQREVLLLLKVRDMSVEEVARATGATVPAVKQRAYRAYQAVRRALGIRQPSREEPNELR